MCRTTHNELWFIYWKTILRCFRPQDKFHDEKRMVLFSIRINFQSCRRDSRRSWTEDFIGRPKVHHFNECKKFHLAITPEGTRKANPNWKKGFYYISLKAQVPIVLIGIDYEKKTISATKAIMPSGDINKDMREIKLYYKDFKGKHPENSALGEIWFKY